MKAFLVLIALMGMIGCASPTGSSPTTPQPTVAPYVAPGINVGAYSPQTSQVAQVTFTMWDGSTWISTGWTNLPCGSAYSAPQSLKTITITATVHPGTQVKVQITKDGVVVAEADNFSNYNNQTYVTCTWNR